MTSTYPVFPPRSGGQSRCFHVARELSRLADVEVVCLGGPQSRPTRREIAPGVVESVVPKSQQHDRIEARVASVMGVPVFDVLAAELIGATPRFEDTLRTASRGASVAVELNPYLHGALRRSAPRLATVYDAHDAAFTLKDQLFPRSPEGDRLRRLVRDVEGAACRDAFVVSTTWEGDARALADEYSVAIDRFVVVPNAADLDHARFVPMPSRRRAAAGWVRAAFPDQWQTISGVAVFVGSWHLPNIRAAEELLEQAGDHRDIALVLVGGHSAGLRRRVLPNTVRVLGPVSDRVLSGMLRSAHVALNPMTQGSGTNVKVVDYLAAGLPVVTTEIGARGLDLVDGEHVVVAPVSAMLERAADLARDPATCDRLAVAGRRLVETRYSWPLALEPLVAAVGQLLDSPVTPRRAEPPSGARARTAR